ncbi:MAG: 50S ribosomal protein L9 [Fusobacterium sp.]|uniref:50S ribosomal protein L9 n=1 Tax=Fusobacterium sp. TaxID=68766 RepID=UPI0026DBA66C|nr:50S ribosomal protein L9 [Fusobacterium sp.]MDO4690344.1 50S ribosomal protein L9 [Fusobacterium sp.]
MAKIQVILLEDVAGQGRKGQIITVSDGYAHNFLIKNKKGVLATEEELKKIENKKKKEEKKFEEDRQKSLEIKKILESKALTIAAKCGENGKLFGAITNKEIVAVIKDEFGLDIDKKKIEANIKGLGADEVTIKLFTDIKAILKVNILAK